MTYIRNGLGSLPSNLMAFSCDL